MTMTYQQQFVLNGVAGRAAILNLTARHNRLFSAGDLAGWIATFRHAGATFIRAGETFTDLRAAFDGGNGQRLVTVDHEITVDGVDATQRCVALLFVGTELRATGTYRTSSSTSGAGGTSRRANSTGMSCQAKTRYRYEPVTAAHPLRVRVRHLRGRVADGRRAQRATVRGHRGQCGAHPAFRRRWCRTATRRTGMPNSPRRSGADWSRHPRC